MSSGHRTVGQRSRFLLAVKLAEPTAPTAQDAENELDQAFPAHVIGSVVADSESELAFRFELVKALGFPTYLVAPLSTSQGGMNEHSS